MSRPSQSNVIWSDRLISHLWAGRCDIVIRINCHNNTDNDKCNDTFFILFFKISVRDLLITSNMFVWFITARPVKCPDVIGCCSDSQFNLSGCRQCISWNMSEFSRIQTFLFCLHCREQVPNVLASPWMKSLSLGPLIEYFLLDFSKPICKNIFMYTGQQNKKLVVKVLTPFLFQFKVWLSLYRDLAVVTQETVLCF